MTRKAGTERGPAPIATKMGLAIAAIAAVILGFLFYSGVLKLNNPSWADYPVRGVDVSAYQGEIDWAVLSSQGISFAFIKATEGSSFVDSRFESNLGDALETGLRIGAYHFFSFDSPGGTQAENFISQVPETGGLLPPVVDFEFYGDIGKTLPGRDETRAELDILLDRLESHYGVRPIIYATEKSYDNYISGHYEAYDIWIRNVYTAPKALENRAWTFWQYTNRGRLDGYSGAERFVDLNVFNGSEDDFDKYGK